MNDAQKEIELNKLKTILEVPMNGAESSSHFQDERLQKKYEFYLKRLELIETMATQLEKIKDLQKKYIYACKMRGQISGVQRAYMGFLVEQIATIAFSKDASREHVMEWCSKNFGRQPSAKNLKKYADSNRSGGGRAINPDVNPQKYKDIYFAHKFDFSSKRK